MGVYGNWDRLQAEKYKERLTFIVELLEVIFLVVDTKIQLARLITEFKI